MKTITSNILNSFIEKYSNSKNSSFIITEKQFNAIVIDFSINITCNTYNVYFGNYHLNDFNGFNFTITSRGKYRYLNIQPIANNYIIIELDSNNNEVYRTETLINDFNKWIKNNENDIIRIDDNIIYMNEF